MTAWSYRYFSRKLVSDIPLHLPDWLDEAMPACIRITTGASIHPGRELWRTSQSASTGGMVVYSSHAPPGYVIAVGAGHRFHVSPDGLGVGVDEATDGRHPDTGFLLTNLVLPMAASLTANPVFHAAAVDLDGGVVLLAGRSGCGKSTLSVSLSRSGGVFLGDDCIAVEQRQGSWYAVTNYASMRLWPDSAAALLNGAPGRNPPRQPGGKLDLSTVAERYIPIGKGDHPITLILLLEPTCTACGQAFRISRCSGGEKMFKLVSSIFRIDTTDRSLNAREFGRIGDIAATIPVFVLNHVRDYDSLPEIGGAIRHLARTVDSSR